MIGKIGLCILLSLLLSACSNTQTYPEQGMGPASVKLAEAASNVSHSLVKLSAIEQAANPQAHIPTPANPSSYGMGGLASIDWSGPIGPLVARIAHATKYRLEILGTAPSIPIVVTLSKKNTPLGYILADAGYQAGTRADIAVFPRRRLMQLRYAKA